MYSCHLGAYRRDRVLEVGGFRPECDGSQDYDLVLRLSERDSPFVHAPGVRYFWRFHPQSASAGAKPYAYQAAERALTEHLERVGRPGTVEAMNLPGSYRRSVAPLAAPTAVVLPIPAGTEGAEAIGASAGALEATGAELIVAAAGPEAAASCRAAVGDAGDRRRGAGGRDQGAALRPRGRGDPRRGAGLPPRAGRPGRSRVAGRDADRGRDRRRGRRRRARDLARRPDRARGRRDRRRGAADQRPRRDARLRRSRAGERDADMRARRLGHQRHGAGPPPACSSASAGSRPPASTSCARSTCACGRAARACGSRSLRTPACARLGAEPATLETALARAVSLSAPLVVGARPIPTTTRRFCPQRATYKTILRPEPRPRWRPAAVGDGRPAVGLQRAAGCARSWRTRSCTAAASRSAPCTRRCACPDGSRFATSTACRSPCCAATIPSSRNCP